MQQNKTANPISTIDLNFTPKGTKMSEFYDKLLYIHYPGSNTITSKAHRCILRFYLQNNIKFDSVREPKVMCAAYQRYCISKQSSSYIQTCKYVIQDEILGNQLYNEEHYAQCCMNAFNDERKNNLMYSYYSRSSIIEPERFSSISLPPIFPRNSNDFLA